MPFFVQQHGEKPQPLLLFRDTYPLGDTIIQWFEYFEHEAHSAAETPLPAEWKPYKETEHFKQAQTHACMINNTNFYYAPTAAAAIDKQATKWCTIFDASITLPLPEEWKRVLEVLVQHTIIPTTFLERMTLEWRSECYFILYDTLYQILLLFKNTWNDLNPS